MDNKEKLKILIKNFLITSKFSDKKKIGAALINFGDQEILDILTSLDNDKLDRDTNYLLNIIIDKLAKKIGVELRVDKIQKIDIMKKIAEGKDLTIISEYLESFEYQKRLLIIEVIEEIGMKELVNYLVQHLANEQHPFIVSKLVKVIPSIGGKDYISVIEPFLDNENDRIVSNAIEGLTLIDGYDFSERISEFISHDSERVRSSALIWMNQQDYEKSFSIAKEMILSKSESVRMAAIYTLSQLNTKESNTLLAEKVLFSKDELDELREKSRELFELNDDEYVRKILKKYYNYILAEKDFDEFSPPPKEEEDIDLDNLLKLTCDDGLKIDLKSELQKVEGIVNIDSATENIGILKIKSRKKPKKKEKSVEVKENVIKEAVVAKAVVAEEVVEEVAEAVVAEEVVEEVSEEEVVEEVAEEEVVADEKIQEEKLEDQDFSKKFEIASDKEFPVDKFSKVVNDSESEDDEKNKNLVNGNKIIDDSDLSMQYGSVSKRRIPVSGSKKEFNFLPVAIVLFLCLGGGLFYLIYPKYVNDKEYKIGEQLYKKGEYEKAHEVFSKIRGYQDSDYYADASHFYINLAKAKKLILTDDFAEGVKIYQSLVDKYNKKEFNLALSNGILELLNDFVESKEFSVKNFEILFKLAKDLGVDGEQLKKAGSGKIFRQMTNRIMKWDVNYIKSNFIDKIDHFLKLDKQKTHMLLGKLLNVALKKKKFKYAKMILKILLKTGYERDNLLREMIVLYTYEINRFIKKKKIKSAYDLFLKLKKLNPGEIIESYSFPNDSIYTAKLYSKFGNHEKAIQIYESLFKKGTISEEKKNELMQFWQSSGDKLMKQNDYFASYPLYKKVFEHNSSDQDLKTKIEKVVKKMITYYKNDNDLENMKKTYFEMLKLFKEDDKYKYKVYQDILYFEGDILLHDRLFSDAKKVFQNIVVKYPDFKVGKEKFIECEMLWAEDMYLRGEYAESSELLEKFSQKFPKEFKKLGIFVSLANAKSKMAKEKFYRGELFEAKKQLLKALEFHSESKLAKGLLEKVDIAIAEDYVKENRFDVAVKLLKESLPELGGKSKAIEKRISEILDKKASHIIKEQVKMKKVEEQVTRLALLEKEQKLKRRSAEIADEKLRKEKMNKYFFIFDDPYYDDRGPGSYKYPTNKIFKTGCFDIRKFEIINNTDTLTFNISIGDQILKDVSSANSSSGSNADRSDTNQFIVGSNGWVFQMFDIYIRYGAKGKHSKGVVGRNVVIEDGWDKAIMVTPTGNSELHQDVRNLEDVLFPSYYSVKNNVFSFNISKSDFDSPPNHEWAYQVVSINFNPEYIENNMYVRRVQTTSSNAEFGGGTNFHGEPNVIDILDSDSHPQFISLSRYKSMPNPKDNEYAKIHLYKFDEIKDMFFDKE